MYNQMTDRYRIVQTEIVKALPLLEREYLHCPIISWKYSTQMYIYFQCLLLAQMLAAKILTRQKCIMEM